MEGVKSISTFYYYALFCYVLRIVHYHAWSSFLLSHPFRLQTNGCEYSTLDVYIQTTFSILDMIGMQRNSSPKQALLHAYTDGHTDLNANVFLFLQAAQCSYKWLQVRLKIR